MEKTAELLRFLLVAAGLLYILTRSVIFAWLRQAIARRHILLMALMYCPACMGFWIGLTLGLLGLWPWPATTSWAAATTELFESALAVCGLGSLLSELWSSTMVAVELEELGYGREET